MAEKVLRESKRNNLHHSFFFLFKEELRREGEIKADCELLADFSQEQEHEEAEW